MIRLALVGFLCASIGWLTGCGLTPPVKPPPPGGGGGDPPKVYPSRSAPESVLIYLAAAWDNRDSVRVDSIYADDYVGESVDLYDTSEQVPKFYKSDEVRVVGELRIRPDIVNVDMDLNPETWARVEDVNLPLGYVKIQVNYIDIRVQDNLGNELRASSPSNIYFTFRPVASDSTWQIIGWREERLAL